jgi:hypothetical protein
VEFFNPLVILGVCTDLKSVGNLNELKAAICFLILIPQLHELLADLPSRYIIEQLAELLQRDRFTGSEQNGFED